MIIEEESDQFIIITHLTTLGKAKLHNIVYDRIPFHDTIRNVRAFFPSFFKVCRGVFVPSRYQ
jgi:hypothetical protein